MKQIKLLIIILSILAAMLLITIVFLNIQKKRNILNNTVNTILSEQNFTLNTNTIGNPDDDAPILGFNIEIQEITDKSILYYISNAINQYFNYIREGNEQAVEELGGNDRYNVQNNSKYVIKQAYGAQNAYMVKYYTYGTLTITNGNFSAAQYDVYMIMYLTTENKGYQVKPITKEEFIDRKGLASTDSVKIEQGTYNTCEYINVNYAKQMEIYLDDYVFRTLNDSQNSYNLLNKEYRDKRFGNINEYIKFLNEKIEQLQSIKITQYKFDDKKMTYEGTDEYGNYYQIKELNYMEYELILDSYTLEDYSSESEEEKVKKSVEKFILMINSADYSNAYKLLDIDFKEKNFQTEEDFINYVKEEWFKRNIIASMEMTSDNICRVKIKDSISKNANTIEKEFKIDLHENMDFTIVFNM